MGMPIRRLYFGGRPPLSSSDGEFSFWPSLLEVRAYTRRALFSKAMMGAREISRVALLLPSATPPREEEEPVRRRVVPEVLGNGVSSEIYR